MPTKGDIAVGVTAVLVALALSAMTGYQYGYDAAKAECKPIRTEIPFKQMSHKQQVRQIKWANRERMVK
jgi:archaeosine-15-forming tRNA-guanine transglycosylase